MARLPAGRIARLQFIYPAVALLLDWVVYGQRLGAVQLAGVGLMAWLRQRLGDELPGVVISADPRPELIAEVRAAGLDYLSKPVKPAALRALLNKHLQPH